MPSFGTQKHIVILFAAVIVLQAVRHDDVNLMVNELTAEENEDDAQKVNDTKANAPPTKKCYNSYFSDWGSSGMKLFKVHYVDSDGDDSTLANVPSDEKLKAVQAGRVPEEIWAIAGDKTDQPGELLKLKVLLRTKCVALRASASAEVGVAETSEDEPSGWILFATAGLRLVPQAAARLWQVMADLNEEADGEDNAGVCRDLMYQCTTADKEECKTIPGAEEAMYEFRAFIEDNGMSARAMQSPLGWIGAGGASLQIGFFGGEYDLNTYEANLPGGLDTCTAYLNSISSMEKPRSELPMDEQPGAEKQFMFPPDRFGVNGQHVFFFSFLASLDALQTDDRVCRTVGKVSVTYHVKDEDTIVGIITGLESKDEPIAIQKLFSHFHYRSSPGTITWVTDGLDAENGEYEAAMTELTNRFAGTSAVLNHAKEWMCNHLVGGINQMRQTFEWWWGKTHPDSLGNPCLEVAVTADLMYGADTVSNGMPGALTGPDTLPACKAAVQDFLHTDLSVLTWKKQGCTIIPNKVEAWGLMTSYGRAKAWFDKSNDPALDDAKYCTPENFRDDYACGNVWTNTMLVELMYVLTQNTNLGRDEEILEWPDTHNEWKSNDKFPDLRKSGADWAKAAMKSYGMETGWCA